jgi:hypothetical protein
MPRRQRLPTLPYHWYYVVRTAANQRRLITDASELRYFRRLLTATLAQCGAHLHFAHLDEHEFHLALQAGAEPLSDAISCFCQQYARAINRVRQEKGPLFRQHAHMLLVQQDKWLLPLGRYIHWIPHLRLMDPDREIWWNSDAIYRRRRSSRGLVTSLIFRRLSRGVRRPDAQESAYRDFFTQQPNARDIVQFDKGSAADSRFLGDSDFISKILQQLGWLPGQSMISQSDYQNDVRRETLKLIHIFQLLCAHRLPANKARQWKRLLTLDNVCSKSRLRPLPMIRALIASFIVANRVATLRQVEHFFGCRPKALSAGRRRRHEKLFEHLFKRHYSALFHVEVGAALLPPRASKTRTSRNPQASLDDNHLPCEGSSSNGAIQGESSERNETFSF